MFGLNKKALLVILLGAIIYLVISYDLLSQQPLFAAIIVIVSIFGFLHYWEDADAKK